MQRKPNFRVLGDISFLSLCSKVRFWAILDFKWAILFGSPLPGHPVKTSDILQFITPHLHQRPLELHVPVVEHEDGEDVPHEAEGGHRRNHNALHDELEGGNLHLYR